MLESMKEHIVFFDDIRDDKITTHLVLATYETNSY